MYSPWQPSMNAMEEIVHMLRILIDPSQSLNHPQEQQKLNRFGEDQDFSLYLSHLMAQHINGVPLEIRQLTGLLLTRQIRRKYASMTPDAQGLVRQYVLLALRDPEMAIRNVAGSAVGAIVMQQGSGGIASWPDLVPFLVNLLSSGTESQVDGALSALLCMLEDSMLVDCDRNAFSRALAPLTPKLLPLLGARGVPNRITLSVLKCINAMIALMPPGLYEGLDEHLDKLADLGKHDDAAIRQKVLQCLTMMLDPCFDILWNSIKGVFLFMLAALEDSDARVVLEAAEFWIAYCELQQGLDMMVEVLPRLVPSLLAQTVFSQEEICEFSLEGTDNDHIPDRPEDVAPLFRKRKGNVDDEDNAQVSTTGDSWTSRKCCAAAMDIISVTFGPEVLLPNLLPHLQDKLSSSDVWVKESAVLCLGAICSGSGHGMEEHMPQLLPFLLAQSVSPCPQLRCMACWSASRYVSWIAGQTPLETYFGPFLRAILARILDKNKKVQEAACSALSVIEEQAIDQVSPYLNEVIPTLMAALERYQIRSTIILYDTIGTLADCLGGRPEGQQALIVLMPSLMGKWQVLDITQPYAFPLMECITSMASALGIGFQNFAHAIYSKCLDIITQTLREKAVRGFEGSEDYDMESCVCTLDLLSALAEGLGHGFDGLVGGSNILQLLTQCMADNDLSMRQSSFALVGDIAKTASARLIPVLSTFVPALLQGIDLKAPSVCINATWALSEISSHVGGHMIPYVQPIVSQLVALFDSPLLNPEMSGKNQEENVSEYMQCGLILENMSMLIARLSDASPDKLAPNLSFFCAQWCKAIPCVSKREDRLAIFGSMLKLIQINPDGLMSGFTPFCVVVAGLSLPERGQSGPPPPLPIELAQMFAHLLTSIRDNLPIQWAATKSQLPAEAYSLLEKNYNL